MIRKYSKFINEFYINDVEVPEFFSMNEFPPKGVSSVVNRQLTPGESKLVDEYLSKFEYVFSISDDVIKDRLADLTDDYFDLRMYKILQDASNSSSNTDINGREEIKDLRSLFALKRWYDHFLNKEVIPTHRIFITKPKDGVDKTEMVYDDIYKMLSEEVKPFFESYTDCEVEIGGGDYQIYIYIKYPKTIIK